MAELTVTQIRSSIGTKPKQRGTLRALGLGKIGKSNTLPDRPEIRGMLDRVPHLVRIAGETDGATSLSAPTGSVAAADAGPELTSETDKRIEEVGGSSPIDWSGDEESNETLENDDDAADSADDGADATDAGKEDA